MIRTLISKLYLTQIRSSWFEYERALANPRESQEKILSNLLSRNAQTQFGDRYGFGAIRSAQEYQAQVPIANYDDLLPWITRAVNGEHHILTHDPVRVFERTSGSTSVNKLIPYTQSFLRELNAGTQAWIYNIYKNWPQLQGTTSYWSISPVSRARELTPGGVPIGMTDDSEYFGPLARWAISQFMAVPGSVAHETSYEDWKHKTCLHLLKSRDLGLISIWSPTFITLLMDEISQNFDFYMGQLSKARAREIYSEVGKLGRLTGSSLWPRLTLVSCWTEAAAAQFIPSLQNWFPDQIIQGKGLLATEGIVSFPMSKGQNSGNVAAVTSHFLEFIDLQNTSARPRLVHELEVGGQYSPLLTTGSGLYRYHLKDVVECTGFLACTPSLKFLGRYDRTSDMCGEKVSVQQAQEAYDQAVQCLSSTSDFFLLIPLSGRPAEYCGVVSTNASDQELLRFGQLLELALLRNTHYAYCRKLGQLKCARIARAADGQVRYRNAMLSRGLRLGDIKPTVLDTLPLWREVFHKELQAPTLIENIGLSSSTYSFNTDTFNTEVSSPEAKMDDRGAHGN